MKKSKYNDHVLPRPVEKLPELANASARKTLAGKLVEAFGLSEEAAKVISDAVIDPSTVRKNIGDPSDPQVEFIPVPGGTLMGVRTEVWSRRVMPDPRNPRIGPSRRHPFAVDPGKGGEESRFRPIPEPRTPDDCPVETPELVVDVESRHHLEWASAQAAKFVLSENDWRESIASQGVMEAVWLAATTYLHQDGTEAVTTLATVEGSSRATAVHNLLEVRSSDIPYDSSDQKLRKWIRALNETCERGPDSDQLIALRCERIPALLIVGFRQHPSGNTGFPTAVKSMVALRHVDPPKPWGDGPENESLADEVLDELYRQDLISKTEHSYYAGSCTKVEAKDAHLSDDPAIRAVRIVGLFTSDDERVQQAIRVAVTSQSTRKRITPKLLNQLATALILRAVSGDGAKIDQIRRYMRHAFSKASHQQSWSATDRDATELVKGAMREVRAFITNGSAEPGPASLELSVRASYPLVVSGRINADRGTANNAQPDRRHPGEVLDAMRRTVQGVHQLGQALKDFADDEPIRAVDEDGNVRPLKEGNGDQTVNDIYLREQFPAAGKAKARSAGDTPTEVFQNALFDFGEAMDKLNELFKSLGKVVGDDGRPIAESSGAEPRLCAAWRETLQRIDDELNVWGRTFQRVHGTAAEPLPSRDSDDDLDDVDSVEAEIDEDYDRAYEQWTADEEVKS